MRAKKVLYREFWGGTKRADLLATLDQDGAAFEAKYASLAPTTLNRFSFRLGHVSSEYAAWASIRDLALVPPLNGPVERRGLALLDSEAAVLSRRMQAYFDEKITNTEIANLHPNLMMTGNRIDGPKARKKILSRSRFSPSRIVRMPWKPLDVRFCYLDNIRPLYSEPSPDLIRLSGISGNIFLITRDDSDTPNEGPPSYFSTTIADYDLLRGHARHFPLLLYRQAGAQDDSAIRQHNLFQNLSENFVLNISKIATAWLLTLDLAVTQEVCLKMWLHVLATTYSPAWLSENADGIRQGWPRIPLPGSAALLETSAALGQEVARLLDSDTPVPGVTQGTPCPEVASIAIPATAPGVARDWRLNGWGHRSDKGITMPGRGRSDLRPYAPTEAATAAHADLLGSQTRDVWMNGASYWKNIPDQVWETHIGGYQVLKKWLSYRDGSILDRPLNQEEVAHVQATARRLAALRLMGPALDASFRACAAAHVPLRPAAEGA